MHDAGKPEGLTGSGVEASAQSDSLGFESRWGLQVSRGLLPASGNEENAASGNRRYQRTWLADRRAAFFAGKACVACGATERLELDHLDKAAKVSHRIWSWSAERRAVEIAKCRVVCEPCHRERHAEERRKPLEHGTANAYKKRGCRCDRCRAWNAAYKADLKARAA